MNLQEIIRNAYLEGIEDATDLGSAINDHDTDELANDYAERIVKNNCVSPDVSQQSELLLAFLDWGLKQDADVWLRNKKHVVGEFIKANNCG